jgi:hypothetical protein
MKNILITTIVGDDICELVLCSTSASPVSEPSPTVVIIVLSLFEGILNSYHFPVTCFLVHYFMLSDLLPIISCDIRVVLLC